MNQPDPPVATNDPTPALVEGALQGAEEVARGIAALVRLARREVRLCAPYLDPAAFNSAAVVEALGAFAVRHPRNRLHLLIEDVPQVLRDNGRLVVLARRAADTVELRAVPENERGARDLYLVVDRSARLVQEDVTRAAAVLSRAAPETAPLIERFNAAWARAEPIALRTLGL